jgi:hypothetical protein
VHRALLAYGLAAQQADPFGTASVDEVQGDRVPVSCLHICPCFHGKAGVMMLADLYLNYLQEDHDQLLEPEPLPHAVETISSFTSPLSVTTDEQLDAVILEMRSHFRRAGVSMLDGMLRNLGLRIPRARIRQSLLRIDPVRRVFERIRIRRRQYQVPGPNSLWHHDGQHGVALIIFLTLVA